MSITSESIKNTKYAISNFSGFTNSVKNGSHSLFSHDQVLVDLKIVPQGDLNMIHVTPGAGGDTIYLTYLQNEITSVRLPVPAPTGVSRFLTDMLDGCTIYIDKVDNSKDLIIYHANSKDNSPPLHVALTNPTMVTDPAKGHMDHLHAGARQDYQANPHLLTLSDGAKLTKAEYFNSAEREIMRKRGQYREHVQFDGSATIFGFAQGSAGWEFYYQTSGFFEYDRPLLTRIRVHNEWFVPRHNQTADRLLELKRFFPPEE